MSTERLHYHDSYCREFTATIVSQRQVDDGWWIALDRTAFYATGGGQPCDYGLINGVPVSDVVAEDGVVWHAVSSMPNGPNVSCELDWGRRFDHMQQHHGQHLLSAAFDNVFGFKTVSFHLSPQSVTIDLEASPVSDHQVESAESLCNQVIWENRPIHTRFVDRKELEVLPLRKAPQVDGPIRVVSVPDFDHSACGGTHPLATGAVGLVHVRRTERRGNETRVEFACGSRALASMRLEHDILTRATGFLSVGMQELEETVQRLQTSEKEARKALRQTRSQLVDADAQEMLRNAPTVAGVPIVCQVVHDGDRDDFLATARIISALGGVAAICANLESKVAVMIACESRDVVDCARILRETLTPFGGRGGGTSVLAQGGLPGQEHAEAFIRAAESAIRDALITPNSQEGS